jgi:REP element-mobilizing transposase RayT
MNGKAVVLNNEQRTLVSAAFGEVIREHNYRALAATVQRTHVHIVFAPLPDDVKIVIARLKRRSTMRVNELYSPAILTGRSPAGSLWTGGRFPIFVFDEEHLANAIEYVRDHNRRIGLPPDPFDWIKPLYPACEETGGRANLRRGEQLRF